MTRLQWTRLLSDYRCPRPGNEPRPSREEPFRSAFEADYDRIVYSAAFRRLARKMQVYPTSPHDHIHNRLTHSIEVASVGRSFGKRMADLLLRRGELPADRTAEDVCQILQAACLAHDIGNPPFGHGGEYAVRQWVRDHKELVFGHDGEAVDDGLRRDWLIFEGNAQGFRLAARADNPQAGYMRLTFATLGAMVKYPWHSCDSRALMQQKFNVFSSEQELFEQTWTHMDLGTGADARRHPLSFLSEAADDICYRILDLEDAVDMNILDDAAVRPVLLQILGSENSDLPLSVLRGQAIHTLVNATWEIFETDYEAIMHGQRTADLKTNLAESLADALEQVAAHYTTIFAHRSKVTTELGAYQALGRIVGAMSQATLQLTERGSYRDTDFLAKRCLMLAWGEAYVTDNEHRPYAWWLHQVMDYFAGLTDNHAAQLSQQISGT
ncbi:dGTP triphosphohydrolase [Roseimaritima ulvae]|uniref:Deoxyguanosinetriphosphate triphosphohydrolase n=1 Tax=Roseimaritima ulvae TaxID=980254 RepID=A0A5B9QY71_9BACT|nr:dNTP triphosphohydrolase [Roseimaritima ulvae]QEG42962.1 Deoxyguanosinetriphosphate triphosphohydrolase [Roseimaritima ulvae]